MPTVKLMKGVYLLQCIQVNINSNLRSQFIWQAPQHFLFINYLLIGPEVVKPANDTLLQHLTDMSEMHVVFESIYTCLKDCSCCIHVGDHGSNITHNGGKNQNTNLRRKVSYHCFESLEPCNTVWHIYILVSLMCWSSKTIIYSKLTKKSKIKNKYSSSLTGGGVSPIVVNVKVDQYRQ